MKSLRSFLSISAVAVLLSAGAVRAADESPFKFEFHGFITGSLYMQNQNFNNGSGQGLLYLAPTPGNNAPCKTTACDAGTFAPGTATKSGSYLGGDVRQSRYVFALSGPQAMGGATPRAYFEGDLFGANPAGPLVESWGWRIRAAFAELKWTNFTFQAGQHSAHLAFAQLPDSLSHIANPISFGAGNFGWRTLGARGLYTVPMGDNKFELGVSVVQASWADNAPAGNVATGAPTNVGSGMASGLPQVEARLRLEGKSGGFGYNVYADGLYQSVNLKGFGDFRPNGVTLADGSVKTSATAYVAELGGKFTFQPVYLAFNLYNGKGLGSMAGALLQMGEIGETAYWVSAGANLTKEFSLTATYGNTSVKEADITNWAAVYANAAPRKGNTLIAGQLKYMDGGYAFALEYISYKTDWMQTATYAAKSTDAYQIGVTAGYFF